MRAFQFCLRYITFVEKFYLAWFTKVLNAPGTHGGLLRKKFEIHPLAHLFTTEIFPVLSDLPYSTRSSLLHVRRARNKNVTIKATDTSI